MKKLFLSLACILVLIPTLFYLRAPAHAVTSTPHIVVAGEVWLMDENGEKLFLLPNSYYARINNLDEAYYFITFNGISGKVSKNVVSTTGYHTTAKGTTTELQINKDYIEFVSIHLKAEPSLAGANVVAVPVTDSFIFLGEFPTADGVWYYVKYNQYYGYIRRERTNVPAMTIADFVPESLPVSGPDPSDEKDKPISDLINGLEGSTLRIIIIIAVAIPAIMIIFILFRPSKGKKEKYYEN